MNFPDKKYNIIYADPPWSFKTYSKKGNKKSPLRYYNTMTKAEIDSLPVKNIAEKDCVLFLWVTYPKLLECITTIQEWGFTYKTCAFSWVKRNKKSDGFFIGLGYWTRANNEICLLATKGKPKRISKSVRQIVDTPLEKHSKKPDCVRERIVELCGDLPRIELFAREKKDGWDVWGNEV